MIKLRYFIYLLIITLFIASNSYSQSREVTARGSSTYRTFGVHRGNQVRTIFGNYGVIAQPSTLPGYPRGAWKYDADGYVGDVSPLVGLKLPPIPKKDAQGNIIGYIDTVVNVQITPVSRPGGGRSGSGGKFWGFDPIPGFYNPVIDQSIGGVAMSNLPQTWPNQWPDQPDWTYTGKPVSVNGTYVTPKVDWNGYFGRAQFNADQESYFWMDDNEDESMFQRYGFTPDSTDPTRRGEALQVSVRGLQWSNFLAQNVIFWLYNIKNDGTTNYDQVVFGTLVGTYVGITGDEYNDDASFFDVRQNITYTWDIEPGKGYEYIRPEANPQWQPNPFAVGYVAYAFLESPGNQYDGIDNDGDNAKFTVNAPYFAASDFDPRVIHAGDKLVLIDPKTYKRSIYIMPDSTVTVYSMGVPFTLHPGIALQEGNLLADGTVNPNAYDGIDNNLNGIIDENYILDYRQFKKSPKGVVLIDTLNPIQHKDYVNGTGLNDPMIDEARDDGIDNNKNWVQFDDVGLDGKPGTGDFGEGDGKPTSGYQKPGVVPGIPVDSSKINIYGLLDTGEPGEPDIDKTDVDESDQIGLTSFEYFTPAGAITMANEVDMWRRMHPGYFDVPASVVNNTATKGEDGDFIVASGYFPLLAGSTERFSLALLFGDNLFETIKTKKIAQTIYTSNYNFPKPPDKPTLTAVPGDKQVTLYWDRVAESTIDKTTKKVEFEGYKIYRGTDPDFSDALQISDGKGQKVFYEPIFQCDLVDGITGYFTASPTLYQLTNGAPYFLGEDSGIQNSYVDKNLTNGRTYYYAVVAYTRGESSLDIFPTENTHYISKDANGNITTDINTAAVVPNAPVLGYVAPKSGVRLTRTSGISEAVPYYEVINPTMIGDSTYEVTFNDSLRSGVHIAYSYNIQNTGNGGYILKNAKLLPKNGIVANGIRLSIDTTYQTVSNIVIDSARTGWINNSNKNLEYIATQFSLLPDINLQGIRFPKDYDFVFSDTYNETSNNLTVFKDNGVNLPIKKTNFKVYDVTDPNHPIRVQYAMTEAGTKKLDTLSANDIVFLSDSSGNVLSWRMVFLGNDSSYVNKGGDTLKLSFTKPLTANDKFTFSTVGATVNQATIKQQLNKIKVVPNPYVITNVYEQPLPSGIRGRGERVLYFTHVPPNCTIRIYTSAGDEVRTLEHSGNLNNGTVQWDLRTSENLEVAYGVYFYVVEVNSTGDKKIGKIAIIK